MNAIPSAFFEQATAETIAQALRYPPSAPKVLPLLKRHLLDTNIPIQQIVDLIRLDPGISARVLQAANSVVFSRGERCHSVPFAVVRIGFDNIFEIVANAVAEQVLVRPLAAYSFEADEFWRRSVTCGLAAEALAEICGEDTNVAYTLGLLHGVGMVAVDHWVEIHQPHLGFFGRGFPRDYMDGEKVLLGCTSSEVGGAVLKGWEFPAEMSEPLRWQHTPLDGGAHRRLNCLLYGAKWLSARLCTPVGQTVAAPDRRALAPIGFMETTLARQLPAIRDRMAAVQRRLDDYSPGEAA